MSQNVLLRAAGLYSFPNRLSSVPQGALLRADNIFINRDNIAESRRGFKLYGTSVGAGSADGPKQLITYKGTILRHYGSGSGTSMDFDSDQAGTFTPFQFTQVADVTSGSDVVDNFTTTANLEVDTFISGVGIPGNTTIIAILSNNSIQISNLATVTTVGATLTFSQLISEVTAGTRLKSVEQNGNLYITTAKGIKKISANATADLSTALITNAGMVRGLDMQLTINAGVGFLLPQSVVAYRMVWGAIDTNNNLILGAPSGRYIIRNTDAVNSKTVDIKFTIPKGVTTAYLYQIYRTAVSADPAGSQDPGDEEQLVFEGNPVATDLDNGYVTLTDITPETFRQGGTYLYTNQTSGEGILQTNNVPPLAKDVNAYKGYTFYANTQTAYSFNFSLLSVTDLVADVSTLTISNGVTSNTYTFAAAEDIATKKVLISTLPTPAQQVNETAESLIRVINNQFTESVYAYYLSGPSDLPGAIELSNRDMSLPAFYLTVDSTLTGTQFSPALKTTGTDNIATNEISPNRLFYSKFQQPEAVPLLNYIDIGPKDKAIVRILASRDNLFVLKEDGIYIVSGLTLPFNVAPFDYSVIIRGPDSATILDNQIYCYSSQGIVSISDTGVQIVSRPIEDMVNKLSISSYTNFNTATFGVSYQSDRSYYFFTVTNTTDTVATQCYRYNTFTSTWTKLLLSKRAGIVNTSDDLLYLSATDTNFIEKERKLFDRTDYADREIALSLLINSVEDTEVALPSVDNMSINDIITQTQYLTIAKYNQTLTKLDKDSILSSKNYFSTLEAVPGNDLSSKMDALIVKIANDAGRVATSGSTSAATYTALTPTGASFAVQQSTFNSLVTLLNNDVGVGYINYPSSLATTTFEFRILAVDVNNSSVTTDYEYPLISGPVTIYNHISTHLQWVPQYLSDVSMTKQVSEGTLIFEDSSFTSATVSYASDLSANFEDQVIPGFGTGIFGNFQYGTTIYGGNGAGVPFRTYLPKEKQRCRYLNIGFKHGIAREIFQLYGLSLTYVPVSNRGWR